LLEFAGGSPEDVANDLLHYPIYIFLAGGSPEDVADELLHYPIYLFLAGDQGEGHSPSFFIFFPKNFMDELNPIYSNAALRQQVAHCLCSPHRR
jgi:hypothetical protein